MAISEKRFAKLEADVAKIVEATSDAGREKSSQNGQGEALAIAICESASFTNKFNELFSAGITRIYGDGSEKVARFNIKNLRFWGIVFRYSFGWVKMIRADVRSVISKAIAGVIIFYLVALGHVIAFDLLDIIEAEPLNYIKQLFL